VPFPDFILLSASGTIISPTWWRRIPTLDSDIDQGRKLSKALSRVHCYQRPELHAG